MFYVQKNEKPGNLSFNLRRPWHALSRKRKVYTVALPYPTPGVANVTGRDRREGTTRKLDENEKHKKGLGPRLVPVRSRNP